MAAVMSLDQLAATTLTPKPASDMRQRDAVTPATAAKLAALEPASTEAAGLPEVPILCLTLADVERLQELSRAVSKARDVLTKAEAELASATKQAKGLVELERRAGALAADAFRGGAGAKAAAKAIAADIEDCKSVARAIPELTRAQEAAMDAFAQARGRLHTATTNALRQAMLRASKRYGELALAVTECVAAVHAGLEALPAHMQNPLITGWYVHTLHDLSLPAMPAEFRIGNSVVEMNFRPSLLRNDHPRLTAHMAAAKGRLHAQLREALGPSGIEVSRLLA